MRFILSGIPRSGTSLLSTMICRLYNTYCFNEILYQIPTVSDDLSKLKLALMHGDKVPNHYTGRKLTTNTSDENKIETRKAKGEYDIDCVVGSKVNTPYMKYVQYFIDNDDFEHIIFLIRNPVYAIASFHNRPDIKESMVRKGNLSSRWWDVPLVSNDVISRQAEIVNWYLRKIKILNDGYDKVHVFRYEDLTDDTVKIMYKINKLLKLKQSLGKVKFINNLNDDKRYSENVSMSKIRKAVKKYCPERSHFGY